MNRGPIQKEPAVSGACTAGRTDPLPLFLKKFAAILFIVLFSPHNFSARSATFVVTTLQDSGPGSLREAIMAVNTNSAGLTNLILFQIAQFSNTVNTIILSNYLPAITNPVFIDGYSQSNASPNTVIVGDNAVLLVELNGSQVTDPLHTFGLDLVGGSNTIRGLVINRFTSPNPTNPAAAIRIQSSANDIVGNFLGTHASGAIRLANQDGLLMVGANSNTIGGTNPSDRNLVSGNTLTGLYLESGTNNWISGNYIGTDRAGANALGNDDRGMRISGDGNIIGGTAPGAGNVISGNYPEDIFIYGASGNVLQGNIIGADASGSRGVLNDGDGVNVSADGNTIGGTNSGAGNIIAFNSGSGVVTTNNIGVLVLGNSIYSNTFLGIDLEHNGISTNDVCDADGVQNYPVLTYAVSGPGGIAISGYLNSSTNTSFRIEFFANPASDINRFGHGQFF